MSGTVAGGKAAARTSKQKYGEDWFVVIGAKGGRNGRTGGFAANRELARLAGAKGGRISRRGPNKPVVGNYKVTDFATEPQIILETEPKPMTTKKSWWKFFRQDQQA